MNYSQKLCNLGLQEGCEVNKKLNINKLSNYIFEDLNFKVESIKGDIKNLTLSFEIKILMKIFIK